MESTEIGEIAQTCWEKIPQHFPYIRLDLFIVMPNHIHGIVIIDKPDETVIENERVSETITENYVETLTAENLQNIEWAIFVQPKQQILISFVNPAQLIWCLTTS